MIGSRPMFERGVAGFLLDGKDPRAVALRFPDASYTYGDIDRASTAVAGHLDRLGCAKGERAVLIADNSFFWVAAYLGTLRAGLVCVPVPPGASSQDLHAAAALTEPAVLFAQSGVLARIPAILQGAHLITDADAAGRAQAASRVRFAELLEPKEAWHHERSRLSADDLAAVMLTSGSTGAPRGVMISHGNVIANTESIIECLSLTSRERMMCVLPFHYCFGTSLLHTHLRVGAELVVDTRFMYPEVVLQRMLDTRCTGFAGVATHFQILLRSETLRSARFPCLRHVQQAGSRLAPSSIAELRRALPHARLFVMYGQTEATARLSCLPPSFLDQKMTSIGRAIPGVRLRVVNQAGVDVKPGEVGEIVAEGQNIAQGYWRAPEETATTFRGRRLHTGDLATVDDDGFFYIVGREKDFLKCRGERISCHRVEQQLLAFDELIEAAIIGVPDAVFGEAVKAFIVPRAAADGLTERVRDFCKGHMPAHLVPKDIVVMRELPRNSAGKVLKTALRELGP